MSDPIPHDVPRREAPRIEADDPAAPPSRPRRRPTPPARAVRGDHEVWDYIEQLNTPLVFADRDGLRVVRANAFAARHFAEEAGALAGAHVVELFAPAERDVVREALERAASGEQVTRRETLMAARTGEEFPARVEFTPISIGGEEFVQVRFADLSMQKRLEAEHRETREYLQHLVESSHMAIVTYGLDGMPKSWNSEAERLFGWSREEVLGGVWPGGAAMMVAGDGAEEELARLREAMESCQAARMKEPVISHRRRRDGSVLITSSVFSPIRDGTGVVIALGEFLRDITEQARTEEKARFLRELNRVIVENIRLGLAVLDTEGKVLYVNPALARMIGRSAAEMVDRRYMDVVEHAATQEAVRRLLEVVRTTGAPAPPGEIDAAPEGVGRRRFRFQGVPLFHGQRTQRLRGVMLIVEDVTEARTLEMQLIQSEKLAAMGQLAAGVAHEIRSPLTTIYNAIYDLRDLVDLGHREVSEDIEIAMEEVRRVQEIINTLLDFARSGGGGALERLDLDEMIARTLRLIAKEFSNQRVTIRQELGAGPIALYFPENAMKQILLNLLTNALHAMPAGGVVTLRTRIAGGARRELVLEVEDTGVGIPEQNLRNIFDPFFTTKEPGRGTGLGLSVVHTAVKDHGGRIEVESVVGTGTLFRIHLPLGRPEGD